MPVVKGLEVELARRVLESEGQQLALVKGLADRLRRSRHRGQVRVSDLSIAKVVDAHLQLAHVLTNPDTVESHLVGQVAVEAQPIGRAVVALVLEEATPRQLRRQHGGLELKERDLVLEEDQLLSQL